MIYRTYTGCLSQSEPCKARDAFRESVKGLGITSAKWRCNSRVSKFIPGDAVWAMTADDYSENAVREWFPGIVTRRSGPAMIVYIAAGAVSKDDDECLFEPRGNGFCRIPISRIKKRIGFSETICPSCERPSSAGHAEGYMCRHIAQEHFITTPDAGEQEKI